MLFGYRDGQSPADSKWKGGGNQLDLEKNWGIYYFDRTPKKVMIKKGYIIKKIG